tara:strand:- start:454 stop:864 length:411 start_codon:yes stop_codon:yes gene_type:complete
MEGESKDTIIVLHEILRRLHVSQNKADTLDLIADEINEHRHSPNHHSIMGLEVLDNPQGFPAVIDENKQVMRIVVRGSHERLFMLEFGLNNLRLYRLERGENALLSQQIDQINYGDYDESINHIILSIIRVPSLRF